MRNVLSASAFALVLTLAWLRPCAAAEAASVAEEHAAWEMSYGAVYYRVYGYVKNESAKPLKYVKLSVELLDATGKPVFTTSGYNQKAEALGTVEGEGADTVKDEPLEKKLAKTEAIAPGAKDLFRIGISKDEMPKKPKFKSYRLKIVEAK
jgi:hypothetical protein